MTASASAESNRRKKVEVHTDGACLGNPGPGGWGALLRYGGTRARTRRRRAADHQQPHGADGGDHGAGNADRACEVVLHTDSQYVRQGITEWMPNWVRRGWKTAGGDPVKNRDLWERLHAAAPRHKIEWHWVKGHSGDPDNERVDVLARDQAARCASAGVSVC